MIKINDRVGLNFDENSVHVVRFGIVKEGKNKGKEYYIPYKFFPFIEQALQHIIDEEIMLSQSETFQEIIDVVQKTKADIEKCILNFRNEINEHLASQMKLHTKQRKGALEAEKTTEKTRTMPIKKRRSK